MVHAARFPASDFPRLDPVRIFGYATAIAVHMALLMLLLVPVTAPPVVPTLDDFRIVWVPAEKEVPPPPPPIEVPVVKRQAHPAPRPVTTLPQPPVQQQPAQDDQGSEPVAVIAPPHSMEPPVDIGPLAGVQLEYATAPAPAYPRDALRQGVQGSVLLKVLVDVDGRPLDVQVARSSGHRALDRAAREQVLRRWTFRPAMRDGRAVQAIGLVPVDFRLE